MTAITTKELLEKHLQSEVKLASDNGIVSIPFEDFYQAIAEKLREEYLGILYEGEGQ